MNVSARIEQAPACEVINLTEAEKDIYHGAGWMLARFHGGALAELFDPQDSPTLDAALDAALAWIDKGHDDELWLVMCSCYQLCEPRRITATDASDMAHMARVFGEAFEGL